MRLPSGDFGAAIRQGNSLVDTATSLGQGGDKGFFKSQAQTHIAHTLELLFELGRPVTLLDAFEFLSNPRIFRQAAIIAVNSLRYCTARLVSASP